MQTIVVSNPEKMFELILEYDKDGVHSSRIVYSAPIPLHKFINCSAIARTGACAPDMADLTFDPGRRFL